METISTARETSKKGCMVAFVLEVLRSGSDDDLVDFNVSWLLDGVSDCARDRVGRNSHFHELAQVLSGCLVRTALGEFRGNSTRRDHCAPDILGMQFHPEAFSQGAARGLGRAINRSTRSEHLDPENGSDVNDVTALLLLHMRQGSGNSIEKPFDIDVNLPVPLIDLKSLHRCDGHDTGVIDEHIDAAETFDGSLDQRFHFHALRHICGKSDGLAAGSRDLLNHCVDPVRTPRSQYNVCSLICEELRGAFSNAAAGSGDDYNFVGDI